MTIINALAGVAVSDLERSIAFYRRVLGRDPDEMPMKGLAEWRFDKGGWLQIFEDRNKAGHSSVTFAESDLATRIAELRDRGISLGPTTDGDKVSTAMIADPDGNQIIFAQGKDFTHRSTS